MPRNRECANPFKRALMVFRGALMVLLFLGAIIAVVGAGFPPRMTMMLTFAVFLVSIGLQLKTGCAFPIRGQGRMFAMWARDEAPLAFRFSIIVQSFGAVIIGIGAIAAMLRS